MSEFIFITGGRRSGKSAYALELAESLGKRRLYIATAEALDDEMAARIERHRAERGDGWATAEAPIDVAGAVVSAKGCDVILIDCLTLWLCNVMHQNPPSPLTGEHPKGHKGQGEGEIDGPLPSIPSSHGRGGSFSDEEILAQVDTLAAVCRESPIPVIAVTNELGLGVIPGDPLSRRYTDLAGIMNQRMAAAADRVVMVVSGIPMVLKEGR